MTSDFLLFNNISSIKEYDFDISKNCGYVYIIEFGDLIKIGKTINPKSRMVVLNSIAKNYGNQEVKRIFVSKQHVNYAKNELILHAHFKSFRVKGELFKLNLDNIMNSLPKLKFIKSNVMSNFNPDKEFRNKILNNYLYYLDINEDRESYLFYKRILEFAQSGKFTKFLPLIVKTVSKNFSVLVENSNKFESVLNELDDKIYVKFIFVVNTIIALDTLDIDCDAIYKQINSYNERFDEYAIQCLQNTSVTTDEMII